MPGGQTYNAAFTCNVGRAGFHSGRMYRPAEYGHGLFGGQGEVNSSPQTEMADREGMMYCAVNWFGFASGDVPNALLALVNLSFFPVLMDRTLQGELNFLYLQRLMISPHGFASARRSSAAARRSSTLTTGSTTTATVRAASTAGGLRGLHRRTPVLARRTRHGLPAVAATVGRLHRADRRDSHRTGLNQEAARRPGRLRPERYPRRHRLLQHPRHLLSGPGAAAADSRHPVHAVGPRRP